MSFRRRIAALVPLTFGLTLLAGCATSNRSTGRPSAAGTLSQPSRREMVRKILPHNVRVFVVDGSEAKRSASGVVVGVESSSKGSYSYVLTNAHALEAAGIKNPRVLVVAEHEFHEEMEYFAEVVAVGKVPLMDLALLRVRGARLTPVVLAEDQELELGEDVIVAAAPYGRAISISGGMISQVERDEKTRQPRMLKTDAPIGYGASGGGVFSLRSGRLLAIVEGYRTAKVGFAVNERDFSFDVPMPGETFAAPSSKVRAFLQTTGFARFLDPAKPESTSVADRTN